MNRPLWVCSFFFFVLGVYMIVFNKDSFDRFIVEKKPFMAVLFIMYTFRLRTYLGKLGTSQSFISLVPEYSKQIQAIMDSYSYDEFPTMFTKEARNRFFKIADKLAKRDIQEGTYDQTW